MGHSFATKALNPFSGSVNLIDCNVEVKSILDHLPLGYPLKADPRAIGSSRREIHILRRVPKPILDLDGKDGSPKPRKPFGIMAIGLDPSEPTDLPLLHGVFLSDSGFRVRLPTR